MREPASGTCKCASQYKYGGSADDLRSLSSEVCAQYATMVNRGDAIPSDQWRDLPLKQQM